MKSAFPDISEETLKRYYKYAKRLRTNGCLGKKIYISERKLKDILGITDPQYFGNRSVRKRTESERLYKRIMRTLALHYLTNLCVEVVLNSTKMRP